MSTAINKKEHGIVNLETGVLLGTLDQYENEQKEAIRKWMHLWSKNEPKFTFARMEAKKELNSFLTSAQRGHFVMLQSFISYEDGVIRKPNRQKTPMTINDIKKTLNLSKSTFYDFWNPCLENTAIIDNGDGTYSVNAKYHFKGKIKGDTKVVKVYNEKVRELYSTIKPTDLGMIDSLIPYVHRTTNFLCSNPYEDDPTQLDKLTLDEIADNIGVTQKTFRKLLKLEIDGQFVLSKVSLGNYDAFMVNPWIMYRLEEAPNDSLLDKPVNPQYPDATLRAIFSVEQQKKKALKKKEKAMKSSI